MRHPVTCGFVDVILEAMVPVKLLRNQPILGLGYRNGKGTPPRGG